MDSETHFQDLLYRIQVKRDEERRVILILGNLIVFSVGFFLTFFVLLLPFEQALDLNLLFVSSSHRM